MGAAASMAQVYENAISWFKKYFDEDMYVSDFQSIDKDQSGGITYLELEKWVKEKASKDGNAWNCLLPHPGIIRIAHMQASKLTHKKDVAIPQRIVDLVDFRNLLIHLFAISILWVHFRNADDWVEGYDFGNLTLNVEEFKLACRTLAAAHANEDITDEQINEDFKLLDTNNSDSLGFLEVCAYCCKYIGSDILRDQEANLKINAILQDLSQEEVAAIGLQPELIPEAGEGDELMLETAQNEVIHDLTSSSSMKMQHQFNSIENKNTIAISAIKSELTKNQNIADFVEIKVATENQIKQILG